VLHAAAVAAPSGPGRSLLAKVVVTTSNYDDVATYITAPPPATPIKVDVTSSATNPPKHDTSFGVAGSKVGSVATAEAIGIAPDATNEVGGVAGRGTSWGGKVG
jgi:hypothetical protein